MYEHRIFNIMFDCQLHVSVLHVTMMAMYNNMVQKGN